jgi:hypothetical protein
MSKCKTCNQTIPDTISTAFSFDGLPIKAGDTLYKIRDNGIHHFEDIKILKGIVSRIKGSNIVFSVYGTEDERIHAKDVEFSTTKEAAIRQRTTALELSIVKQNVNYTDGIKYYEDQIKTHQDNIKGIKSDQKNSCKVVKQIRASINKLEKETQ